MWYVEEAMLEVTAEKQYISTFTSWNYPASAFTSSSELWNLTFPTLSPGKLKIGFFILSTNSFAKILM